MALNCTASNIRMFLIRPTNSITFTRSYFKFRRTQTPPLLEPKESPYIVGPYLKPDYLEPRYITEAIKARDDNDLNHFIYEPIEVKQDEDRTVSLLLIEDVEGLGIAGQVVDAPYRLGASKLVAMRKAEYATDFELKWHKFGPKTFQSASSALSPRTARILSTRLFDLPVSKDIIIQPWHISLALRLSGCICPIEAIEKNSIEEYKDDEGNSQVKCAIRINNHERVEVKFVYCLKASLLA